MRVKCIHNIIIIGISIFIANIFFMQSINENVYTSAGGVQNTTIGEISENNELIQVIVMEEDVKFNCITFLLATYGRENTNINNISLYINDELDTIYEFNSSLVEDNARMELEGNDIELHEGDKLTLVLSSEDYVEGNGITAWVNPDGEDGTLYCGNYESGNYKIEEGSAIVDFSYKQNIKEAIKDRYSVVLIFGEFLVLLVIIIVFLTLKLLEITLSELKNSERWIIRKMR